MVNLNDLLEEQLREMYDGEQQCAKALTLILPMVTNSKLCEAIIEYKHNCEDQVIRLKQVFNLLYKQKRGEQSEVMRAMVHEAQNLMDRSMDFAVMDAGIITAVQRIIHYKIAGYGAICNYTNTLGLYEEAGIVHKNLEVEKKTDKTLANLAESSVNLEAV